MSPAARSLALLLVAPSLLAAQGKAGQAGPTPDARVTRADLSRIAGRSTAKAWVLVFSDFQCPVCKEFHATSYRVLQKEFVETGQVRLAYVNFPLRIHPNAVPAAEAAMCAGAQDRFWAFHDRVFATVGAWAPSTGPDTHFVALARQQNLDLPAFRRCLADDVMLPLIQVDQQRGTSAGVNSTPSFLIGDRLVSGLAPIEVLRKAVREAVAAAR